MFLLKNVENALKFIVIWYSLTNEALLDAIDFQQLNMHEFVFL